MDPLVSQVDVDDAEHRANRAEMDRILSEYRQVTQTTLQGGGADAVAKHKKRGKLLARERIDALVDPGSPFLEFSALAAHGMYDG